MSKPTGPVRINTTVLTRHHGPQVINPGIQAEQLVKANQPRPAMRKVDIAIDPNRFKATGYPK